MTTVHGNKGYVSIGSDELKVKSFSLNITAPATDDTDIGDEWETNIDGAPKSWSGTLTCSLKKSDAAQSALEAGALVTVGLYSAGNGTGETFRTGTARVETVDYSQDPTNPASVTFNFKGNGPLTADTVA